MVFDKEKFLAWVVDYTDYQQLKYRTTEAFSGWSSKDPQAYFTKTKDILNIAEEVVDLVERFSKDVDSLSSKDKLDLAVEFIDDLVNFPFLLEWVDDMAIKYLLSSVVQLKNKWFGKEWFND